MRQSRWLGGLFLLPGSLILARPVRDPHGLGGRVFVRHDQVVGLPQLGFTTVNYHDVFRAVLRSDTRTRRWSTPASRQSSASLLGYPLAYFATRFAGRWDKIIIAAIILTWVVDYLVRIYAWA